MPRYRLTRAAWLKTSGETRPKLYPAGSVIATDARPADSWIPLDNVARATSDRRSFEVAPNGIQVVDRKTGTVRVTRVGEKIPRAIPHKGLTPEPHDPRERAWLLPGEGPRRPRDAEVERIFDLADMEDFRGRVR